MTPPIIEYLNLVKRHKTPKAKPVKDFLKEKKEDRVLARRVDTLAKLMSLKELLK